MKVALIIDSWFPAIGGGQINSWEISKRLANKNLKIDIITRNCGEDALEKSHFLKVYKLGPQTRPDSLLSEFYFLINLFFFLLARRYDLIHVHPFLPAIPAKILSLIRHVPIILTVHGTRLFENEKLTPSRFLEKFILTTIKYNHQISVTKAFLKIPNVNKKISVIPNGINLDEIGNVTVKKFSNPTILWVGRFDSVKRVEDLIVASKTLSKKIKRIRLILVGYGYQKKQIMELANKLGAKNVIFEKPSSRKDLINLYKRSHVFALPSASEGQPLTILEAQAVGLPVVASNVGGIPEIVQHKKSGLLVPPKNTDKLSEAILYVLKKKNNFGKYARQNIKKFYSWDSVAKQTLKVYKNLVN
jgi:glycosyltransferase involved in cell wall biosynthesis